MEKTINSQIESKDVFIKADRTIKRIGLAFLLFFLLMVVLAYIDRPEYMGEVGGTVVSVSIAQKEVKSFSGVYRVNVQLDDGVIVYTERSRARVGEHLSFRMYKRRVTGFVSYR